MLTGVPLLLVSWLSDAAPVHYRVELPAPQTQMVEMSMVVPDDPDVRGATFDVRLPTWRPGRYEILDPAGTVREVRAWSGTTLLDIEKTRKDTWRITRRGDGPVTVRWRVWANSIGDRTRHVDDTHAFLSPSAVFLYAPALRDHPVEVTIDAPPSWTVATGLERVDGDPRRVTAPGYDVLVDSPLEIGAHQVLTFDALGAPHEIVIWPPDVELDADVMTRDFTAIVEACAAVFGDARPYERYVFLIHAGAGGGGTEHLNSTIMQTSRAAIEGSLDDGDAYERFLGLVAHEFFHTWNVKQLRPAGLVPYAYHEENYTPLLWIAEGTTSYYDDLLRVRADLLEADEYLKRIARAIGALRRRPGARVQSLEASSFDAWIKFNQSTADAINSTVSFYSKGALASLLLDLDLRARTDDAVTLDVVMRTLFEQFPLDGGGYDTANVLDVLAALSGADYAPFHAAYVAGTADLPFEAALAGAGLTLEWHDPDADEDADPDAPLAERAVLGVELRDRDGRTTVRAVLADGPAADAGVNPGDEIVALDGRRLTARDLDERLERFAPGDTVTLHLMRRDALRAIELTLAGEPRGAWRIVRVDEPTDVQRSRYEAWLGVPWPDDENDDGADASADDA